MNPLQLLSGLGGQIFNTAKAIEQSFRESAAKLQHQRQQQQQQPRTNYDAKFQLIQALDAARPKIQPFITQQDLDRTFNYVSSGASKVKDSVFKTLSNAGSEFSKQPLLRTPIGQPIPHSPTIGQSLSFAKSVTLEPLTRIGFEGAQTLNNDSRVFTPQAGLQQFLFGKEPLRNWNDPKRPAREMLRGFGMNEQDVNKYAPTLIAVGALADAIPFGGGGAKKKVGELGFKEAAEQASKSKLKEFSNIFSKWIGQRDVAVTTGTQIAARLKNVPIEKGMEVISYLERPYTKVNPEIKGYAEAIKKEFDQLYLEANRGGLDIGYLKNYITHIWKESQQEIDEFIKTAPQTFRFAKERRVPTYAEGMGIGLTPKYTHPAEILNEYTRKLHETRANIELLNDLKKMGVISNNAQPGYIQIIAPGIKDGYFAPSEIAQKVNRIFSPTDDGKLGTVLDFGAKVSSKVQDITMSGGLPKTPLNAFSFAQITKEMLAGRLKSPLISMLQSIDGGKSSRFFEKNVEQIKKLQARNVPVTTNFQISNLIDKGVIKNLFGESIGEAWDKTVNEPTFKRLLPMLQIRLFNDIENAALKSGKNADQAADIAAKAVKNFYGITDTGKQAMRTKISQDAIGTFFFAPKYRESMINFWLNNIKSLKNPLARENRTNFKFLIGAVVLYAGMDQMNKSINGHGMQDNPAGTEDKLLIPLRDGNTLGIPFLSSIATMPRAFLGMGKSALEGDFPEVVNQGKAFLSTAIKPPLDIMANQNYFGQEIYNAGDSGIDKAKDIGTYLFGAYQHPYVRAGIEKAQGKYPDYQIGLKTLELPLRFYKTKSLEGREFYAAKDRLEKGLTAEQRQVTDFLTTSQTKGGADTEERAKRLLKDSWALNYYKQLQLASDPQHPLYSRSDEEIKGYLAYQLSNDTKQKAKLRFLNPWIPDVQEAISQKFAQDTGKQINAPTPMQQLSSEQVKIVSLYTSLPQGSVQRKQLLAQNPWLIQYWNANEQYYTQNPFQQTGALADYLKSVGIDPNTQTSTTSNFSSFPKLTRQQRSINAMKPRVTNKKLKIPKGKKLKAPKIKIPKFNFKPLKVQKPKKIKLGGGR